MKLSDSNSACRTVAPASLPSEPMKGLIFNLMRYSTHDGPGIRTTVFLKGCPLRCWWCHNPENWIDVPREVYLPERCTGCGICIENCPAQALAATPEGIATDPALCRHCGRCVEVCPSEARERTLREASVEELAATIERDAPFYEQSGGGVTFSGGEPLCQPGFLLALLEACGRMGIHRAVDTSGYAPAEILMEAAGRTDLFLYDLKVLDPDRHRAHTGVDNRLILSNLRRLSAAGHAITVRIPLIPGLNDDDASIAELGRFIRELPQTHAVDLLPFHRAAKAKYRKLGLSYRGEGTEPHSSERIAAVAGRLAALGLRVNVGG